MELDLDITYILVIALFLVPVLILNSMLFRPFLRVFEERHDRLEGALARADAMLHEAERQAEAFKAQIRAASAKGEARRQEVRQQTREHMDARVDEEKRRLGEKLSAALTELEDKRQDALKQMEREAEELAVKTASKILGRSVA
jgi:F-type H+-transporting ATPase subunit b